MTMQDYLSDMSRELRQRNYSPRTVEIYSNCVRFFLKYIKGDVSLISRDKVVDFILYLQSKNRAPKTINLYKEAIKFFVKEVLKKNIDLNIKLSKEPRKLPVVLSNKEILTIVDHISNKKHKLMIFLAYSA
jgi:uncharacterized protein YaaR (DUF327 family)